MENLYTGIGVGFALLGGGLGLGAILAGFALMAKWSD